VQALNDYVLYGMYLSSPYFTGFLCHFILVHILTSLQLLLEVAFGCDGYVESLDFPLFFVKCGYR